jgi:hypothetical protein
MASVGVILLGVDKLFVSADSNVSFAKSFTVLTILGLVFLMAAAIWFYKMSFD